MGVRILTFWLLVVGAPFKLAIIQIHNTLPIAATFTVKTWHYRLEINTPEILELQLETTFTRTVHRKLERRIVGQKSASGQNRFF